jgi:chorismate mutase
MDKFDKALLILFALRPMRARIERLDSEVVSLCKERDQLTRKIEAAEHLLATWLIQSA